MLDAYQTMERERAQTGLPPLALTPAEVEEVCRGLETAATDEGAVLRTLLENRVPPGVDAAAKIKAGWLAAVAKGAKTSPAISRTDAVAILGTMLGGYNVEPLVEALSDPAVAAAAANALKRIILVYGAIRYHRQDGSRKPARQGRPRVLGGRGVVPVPAGFPR